TKALIDDSGQELRFSVPSVCFSYNFACLYCITPTGTILQDKTFAHLYHQLKN
ncbi:24975_t:CDS:1, partial [Gigaspora margarita]